MTFSSLLALACGLAMDASAVAATRGFALRRLLPRHFVLVALLFGGFQALMPLLGFALGSRVGPLVASWDHWIAFVLLCGIGIAMIFESRKRGRDLQQGTQAEDSLGFKSTLLLAIATSVDAFAVGVTLPMLKAPLLLALATIGITTAVLSAVSLAAGRRFGAKLGSELDVLGGVVLVLMGTKILIEHLS